MANRYMRFLGFFICLSYSMAQADIYNHTYSPLKHSTDNSQVKKINPFLDGNFEKILRFDKLTFTANSLDSDSQNILDDILLKIKNNQDKSNKVLISLIGHASQDKNKQDDSQNNALLIEKVLTRKRYR